MGIREAYRRVREYMEEIADYLKIWDRSKKKYPEGVLGEPIYAEKRAEDVLRAEETLSKIVWEKYQKEPPPS